MSSILFIFSGAPHTSLNAQEGLDALLMGSAFTDCRLLLIGDGVTQLIKQQDAEQIGRKNYTQGFAALKEYGVTSIACRQSDLEDRGIASSQLAIDVDLLDDSSCRDWLESADKVLNFR
ncbi:MAG: sulfurtransferase complex subunit TusC [Pseudomonadales bacterium]|jgi:tRNA 2-thiouridine synthesizing protein C|nr:sulfurtransferase complex subunit TusC [Pseudomonadales bacterium]